MITDGRTGFRYEPHLDRGVGPRPEAGSGQWQRTGQRLLRRLGAYLASRRSESWLFFAAGFVLATFLT